VAERVAVYDRFVGTSQLWTGHPIHEDVKRPDGKTVERAPHGEDGGAANVEGVDLVNARRTDPDGQSALAHQHSQAQPRGGCQQFRITHAADRAVERRKYNGRGHHWTGQWTAACFVNSGDESPSLDPERAFALE
jgi:hypothetical protein